MTDTYFILSLFQNPLPPFPLWQVVENTWVVLRDQGAVIEEPVEDEDGDGGEKVFDEKTGLQQPADVVEIHLGDQKVSNTLETDVRTEDIR